MFQFYLILSLLGLVAFQQTPASVSGSSCLHRTLSLNVDDSKGFPIQGITLADFEARLRGRPVKIVSIVPDDRPHRIVILIDASGSVHTKRSQVLSLASALAETRLPNAQIALVIFGTTIYEQIGFSPGQSAVAEKLRQIRSDTTDSRKLFRGMTALNDSLLAGLKLLETPTSADSLYLLSDVEGDNASRVQFQEVAHRLTSSGVRLFVAKVIDGSGNRPTPEETDGSRNMSDLVRRTGGEVILPFGQRDPAKPKGAERITVAMNLFHQRLIQNSRLEIELTGPLDKPRTWELKLSGEQKKQWKNARLMYPTELAPCKP